MCRTISIETAQSNPTDYTYEYADLFKSADLQPDIHTVSIWANFIW